MMTDDDLLSFGAQLKHFRTARHLTQQQLAQELGVHRNAISRWEQGDVLPASKAVVLELARVLSLGDQDARQLLEASLTALAPYWSVPLPRNPYFTGREETLQALHEQLGVEQAVALTQSSALHGLGGVGKTQIALEYAYRYAFDYRAVFWISAETEEQIIASFLHMAEVLQLPGRDDKEQQKVVAAVQRWLSAHDQWLLIWDNVEALELLQRFLPAARQGAILITTRCQALGTLAQGWDLRPMEQEEATLFLLRRAKVLEAGATREQMQQFAARMPEAYAAASEVVTALGGLPLALDQAGAYIEETRCGLSAYLSLFHTHRSALLQQRGELARDHPESVATTLHLAITAATRRHSAVRELLQVCAFLQPDTIPEALFLQGGEHLGTQLAAMAGDELIWNQLVAAACSSSLLARQPATSTLSLHRLVQALLLDTLPREQQASWVHRLILAFDAVFPTLRQPMEANAWKRCEQCLPHVLLLFQRIPEDELTLAFASLANKAAIYLWQCGRYQEAEPLLLRALHIREQLLGPDHLEVAHTLNYLAGLCWLMFRYEQTEALLLRILHIREQALGADHAEIARVLNNLAVLQHDRGNYEQAEALHLRALHIREHALGMETPLVANTLALLADTSLEQGNDEQAEVFLLRARHIWEKTLGMEHPDAMRTLARLGKLYIHQGKNAEAEASLQQGLRICERHWGADHPDVASMFSILADLYQKQGNDEQAEQYYQRARHIWEQALGPENPLTAHALHGLALLRQKQGNKLNEALALAERALHIRSQALGETHPKTVATRTLHEQLLQELAAGTEKTAAEQEGKAVADTLYKSGDASSSAYDPLQEFLEACCELHPRAWCRISELWQAYEYWVDEHHERFPLPRRAFAAHLKARGCSTDRTSTARIWRGITLREPES